METFLPLVERLGLPLSFLAIAIIAFVRGDVVPKYIIQRLQADLDRERRETDRFLDMCIRLLEDARDSQHISREAVQTMRGLHNQRNRHDRERTNQDEGPKSILDREEGEDVPRESHRRLSSRSEQER